jgi:hypothetical protein
MKWEEESMFHKDDNVQSYLVHDVLRTFAMANASLAIHKNFLTYRMYMTQRLFLLA